MFSSIASFFHNLTEDTFQATGLPEMSSFLKSLEKVNISHQKHDLVAFDLIHPHDPEREIVDKKLKGEEPFSSPKESKAFAMLIGTAIGDSLGFFSEALNLDYQRNILTGFENVQDIAKDSSYLRAWPGQYTDDTALALCIADSLIDNKLKYNGKDLRYRFLLWFYNGYNNGKRNETDPQFQISIGIGITTYNTLVEFVKNPSDKVDSYGKKNDENGNGSIMRLAPIPIAFSGDLDTCLKYAGEQSFTTHNGIEASECSRLLCYVMWHFLNLNSVEECKEFLDKLADEFKTSCESVECLAKSCKEKEENLKLHNPRFNKTIEDRNWDWKSADFKYSPHRSKAVTLVGLYCMDATAMALHIIYHTKSFKEAILKAVNLGGDADTVGAIVGMLAGSLYGYEEDMKRWYFDYVAKWDEKKCAIRAYKLLKMSEEAQKKA